MINEFEDNPNYYLDGLPLLYQFSLLNDDGTPVNKYLMLLGGVVGALFFRILGYIALRFTKHQKA